jgi:putative hydrolase of the HAD superfamily
MGALVLDFGGVITRTLFETHRLTEAALDLPTGTLTWLGPFAPATDPLWTAMQRDELSERDYWSQRTTEVAALVGADWSEMAQFVRAARGSDPDAIIRPEAVAAVRHCVQRKIPLAILSNELDLFYGTDFRSKLPLLENFDVIIDATYSKILKPDQRAYLQCAEALALTPSECVFVDDQPRNVCGADDAGMQSVLFDVRKPAESFQQALDALTKITKEPVRA